MLLDSSEALVEAISLTENVKCNLSAAEAHEYLNYRGYLTRNLHACLGANSSVQPSHWT